MNNPQVIKLRTEKYPNDPPDYLAEVYERHPKRGDVYLLCCANKNTQSEAEQAANDYMKSRAVFGTTFLPIEG